MTDDPELQEVTVSTHVMEELLERINMGHKTMLVQLDHTMRTGQLREWLELQGLFSRGPIMFKHTTQTYTHVFTLAPAVAPALLGWRLTYRAIPV